VDTTSRDTTEGLSSARIFAAENPAHPRLNSTRRRADVRLCVEGELKERCIPITRSTSALSRDGEPEENFVWKDTVLLRAGQTIDILLDVTNPGLWMAHCHIAEHTESGMMFSFDVAPATDPD